MMTLRVFLATEDDALPPHHQCFWCRLFFHDAMGGATFHRPAGMLASMGISGPRQNSAWRKSWLVDDMHERPINLLIPKLLVCTEALEVVLQCGLVPSDVPVVLLA